MAWGWFDRKRQDPAEWTGFLEQGVKVEGRLESSGTFRIDSAIKGTLVSEDTLILGEHSTVRRRDSRQSRRHRGPLRRNNSRQGPRGNPAERHRHRRDSYALPGDRARRHFRRPMPNVRPHRSTQAHHDDDPLGRRPTLVNTQSLRGNSRQCSSGLPGELCREDPRPFHRLGKPAASHITQQRCEGISFSQHEEETRPASTGQARVARRPPARRRSRRRLA